ncbi:MAG: hypothetical protein H6718_04485 [Polyangiaceae bacterium]|nr:hypothetical protein [Polyangiaceae bacterium]MCB9609064.1 hypothetical protein [Polyangiaceae bacterium]
MRSALGLLLLGCLSACSGQAPSETSLSNRQHSNWQPLAQVRFESDGETPWVRLPTSTEGVALRVTAEPGVCFELSGAESQAGEVLAQRFAGQECSDCAARTSVAAEAGVFILPEAAQVRFGVVDCETLNPRGIAAGGLDVDMQPLAEPASRELPLRLYLASDSELTSDTDRERMLAAVDAELVGSGLTSRVTGVERLTAPGAPLRFHAGDASELALLLAEAPQHEREIRVVIAGCLEYADPLFGPPVALDGYTPRVLGGAGAADGVFLPDVDCTSSRPLSLTPEARGRVLAHELGHYLGLFHTDPASDDADNLMHPKPALATAHGLTPTQVEVLLRHPVLR